MTTTLFLGQNVDLRQEARVRRDRAGLGQHHPALHFLLPDSSKKKADVVPRSSLVQELPEHLDSRDHRLDRKSTRLNSSHSQISYAVFCLKKKKKKKKQKTKYTKKIKHTKTNQNKQK